MSDPVQAPGSGCSECALQALEPAAWTFALVEGLEPTNHLAEPVLPSGVPWRKNAFGRHNEAGRWFAVRILTVVQTLRFQQRPVLDSLYHASCWSLKGTEQLPKKKTHSRRRPSS